MLTIAYKPTGNRRQEDDKRMTRAIVGSVAEMQFGPRNEAMKTMAIKLSIYSYTIQYSFLTLNKKF